MSSFMSSSSTDRVVSARVLGHRPDRHRIELATIRRIEDGVAPDGSPVELYLRFPGAETARLIDEAVPAGATVLDLGCGVGRISGELVRLGHRVAGVDNSPDMLRHADNRGLETIEAEIQGLELGRHFDVVLLLSHFVNEADDEHRHGYWRAAVNHAGPGGLVVVERFTATWVRTVQPATTVAHGVETELHHLVHDGDVLHARITYRIDGRAWTQSFDAIALDDAVLDAEAANHDLTRVRALDDDGELILFCRPG
jgi:SAM-dependent methyltransferase